MLAYVVEVYVKEDCIEDFRAATIENHKNTVWEPGNYRFDVLQSNDDPCRWTLYEVYDSEDDVKAHKQAAHYLRWKETVGKMMARPRSGIKHEIIAPEDKNKW